MHQQQTQAAMASSHKPTNDTVLTLGSTESTLHETVLLPYGWGTQKLGNKTLSDLQKQKKWEWQQLLVEHPPRWQVLLHDLLPGKQEHQQALSPGLQHRESRGSTWPTCLMEVCCPRKSPAVPTPRASPEAARDFSVQTLYNLDVLSFCKTQHVSELTPTHIQV